MKLIYLSPALSPVEALLVQELYRTVPDLTVQHGGAVDPGAYTEIEVYGDGPLPANLADRPRGDLNRLFAGPTGGSTAAPAAAPSGGSAGAKFIVGITSCPTGVAHTYMAAEGLQAGAEALGYRVKIETQGSVGADNVLTAEDIAAADVVIIAADTNVALERFAGKRLYRCKTKPAINDGAGLIQKALAEAPVYQSEAKAEAAGSGEGGALGTFYKHLMTGVSHMLPFVVAGGLLIALGFAIGSYYFGENGIYIYKEEYQGNIGHLIFGIGKTAFKLFVPVMAGFIGFSIAGRPALAPAMVGGLIADEIKAGFLGGILAGYLAGYLIAVLNKAIKLPRDLEALKPTLILPLLGTLIVGLLMHKLLGPPVAKVMAFLEGWLTNLQNNQSGGIVAALLLGGLLGGMMAVDMGGPVNKAAYTVSVGLAGSQIGGPMAATMAGGMVPPLAIFFATIFFRNRFTQEERDAGKSTGVLGLSFITEGAIPFAAKDPLRVIPALVLGSALTGAISMALGCELRPPHGGFFVLLIPNAINHLLSYVIAIAAGTALATLLLGLFKKPLLASV